MSPSATDAYELGEREAERDIDHYDKSLLREMAKTAERDAYHAEVYDRNPRESDYWTAYAMTILDYLADNPDLA